MKDNQTPVPSSPRPLVTGDGAIETRVTMTSDELPPFQDGVSFLKSKFKKDDSPNHQHPRIEIDLDRLV